MSSSGKKRPHSSGGCDRCKRRRQKCDEAKPTCGRCLKAGEVCHYRPRISWGGRQFSKSRFGVCLQDNGVSRIQTGHGTFIYTTTAPGPKPLQKRPPTPEVSLTSGYGVVPKLPPDQQFLLQFFSTETSRIMSCHREVWQSMCQVVIPMAIDHPYLMSAILAVAGNYWISSSDATGAVKEERELCVARLRDSSIRGLRVGLDTALPKTEVALATALFLCLHDIHSGSDRAASWRVHFEGAKTLMSTLGPTFGDPHDENQDRWRRLFTQIYTSIEVNASLSLGGVPRREYFLTPPLSKEACYVDEYYGLSSTVRGILCEIGALAYESRCAQEACFSDFLGRAEELEKRVLDLINQDEPTEIVFHPRIAEQLSPTQKYEYSLSNTAYQHAALITIRRRLRGFPGTSPEIQIPVKRILDLAGQMNPSPGLSPWLLMSTPLFTAGSEAIGSDRDTTRDLLERLRETIKLTNYKRTIDILEDHWSWGGSDEHITGGLSPERYPPEFMPW